MSKLLIETTALNFGFDNQTLAVRDLNLKVPEQSIFGFLGPNGAGKTTTIRLILGLLKPANGKIQMLGKSLSDEPMAIYSQIGALIETPSLYLHLSGFDNLNITRKIRNLDVKRIHHVLAMVKLTDAAYMLVKKYSLGMKQRLGIALALLSNPTLLILDEPTNGLDPNGMIETRELLTDLNRKHGITLFISSHLLSEIEKLITNVAIIKDGSLMFQGSLEKLKEIRNPHSLIHINTSDNERANRLLVRYESHPINADTVEVKFQNKEQVANICRTLADNNISLYRLDIMNDDLESKFFEILKH